MKLIPGIIENDNFDKTAKVKELENLIQINLPTEYFTFLSNYKLGIENLNIGNDSECNFYVAISGFSKFNFNGWLTIEEVKNCWIQHDLNDYYNIQFLHIAQTIEPTVHICIALSKERFGKVYWVDFDMSPLNTDDIFNQEFGFIVPLSNSFIEFCNLLKIAPIEDLK